MRILISIILLSLNASSFAQPFSFFNQTCSKPGMPSMQNIGKAECRDGVVLASMPAAFKNFSAEALSKQDEDPSNYTNYSDFKDQLGKFLATDIPGSNKSKDSACMWLFWSNGAMRRPFAGTLCAIAKYSGFIKSIASMYKVPPEYIACAIGGDSMIVSGSPDYVANSNVGKVLHRDEQILDLVQSSAFDDGHPNFQFVGKTDVEKLIEKIAVIGKEAKAKYTKIYQRPDLFFSGFSDHEAAILATIYNKGITNCNPVPPKEPTLNYFGLSCLRLMKVYQAHLDGNPSAGACL